jgi:hypothetical protein
MIVSNRLSNQRKNNNMDEYGTVASIDGMLSVVNHPCLKAEACSVRDMGNWLTRRH